MKSSNRNLEEGKRKYPYWTKAVVVALGESWDFSKRVACITQKLWVALMASGQYGRFGNLFVLCIYSYLATSLLGWHCTPPVFHAPRRCFLDRTTPTSPPCWTVGDRRLSLTRGDGQQGPRSGVCRDKCTIFFLTFFSMYFPFFFGADRKSSRLFGSLTGLRNLRSERNHSKESSTTLSDWHR